MATITKERAPGVLFTKETFGSFELGIRCVASRHLANNLCTPDHFNASKFSEVVAGINDECNAAVSSEIDPSL